MRINNNREKFSGALNKTLNMFYNSNAAIPTLIIETGVTLGRSALAQKRGGKRESAERFVEQGTSAIVWIWGVQFIKKIGDFIGEKFLKKDLEECGIKKFSDFDAGCKNFNISSKLKNFKSANILLSTALATGFIGFVLPKISRYIAINAAKKEKEKENKHILKAPGMDEYKKSISFRGMGDCVNKISHILENNQKARLLITDTGVIAGRCHSAKNKYKKIEGVFRDVASIYFYLRATKDVAHILNKLAKNIDINPDVLDLVVEKLIHDKDRINSREFLDKVYDCATKGAYSNSLKYVSKEKLEGVKKSVNEFLKSIEGIEDVRELRKIAKKNKLLNLTFYSAGIAFSIFNLAYLIPKVQYFITKKLTKEDKFPQD